MAKKQKRKTSTGAGPQKKNEARVQAPVSSRAASAEFKPDYTAVKKDLRRIGILASSFFVILIVLSFILR